MANDLVIYLNGYIRIKIKHNPVINIGLAHVSLFERNESQLGPFSAETKMNATLFLVGGCSWIDEAGEDMTTYNSREEDMHISIGKCFPEIPFNS